MNWGNKLLITFVAFGAGMSYLVYRAVHTNFELVEKDYYKTELAYQQTIDAQSRYNQLNDQVILEQVKDGLRLRLPAGMKNKTIDGQAWFYCAYDATKDKKIKLSLNEEASQLFTVDRISPGNYTVKINWTAEENSYYTEKNVTVR